MLNRKARERKVTRGFIYLIERCETSGLHAFAVNPFENKKVNETQKIKLLIFIPTLECGGTEKYVSLLCNNIDTNKFDVTLAVLNDAHPFYEIKNTIEVVDLHTRRVRHSLSKIKKLVREKQPDIIFSNANHLNLLFAMYRSRFPQQTTIIARESSIVSINSKRATFPALYQWLIKKYYRRLDHIICQSDYMRQDLVTNFKFPESKTTVIHNPAEEISKASMLPAKNKFITVARLSEEKGIDRLIRAVARLSIPFQYFIIGEGNQRKTLEKLIVDLQLSDKVFLTGEKINPYQGMEDASLMLSGSLYEGFPNSLLEAGMLGIPVIAFDAPGGTGEIIRQGENGLLVKDSDGADFAMTIEKALQMNFDRANIIADTAARYGLKRIVGKIEALFLRDTQSNHSATQRY